MTDGTAFLLLQIMAVADAAAAVWLVAHIVNRRAKAAILTFVAMLVVTLAILVATLPNWAC